MSQNHIPRSNPCYQAVVAVLEERGIKHTIKYGGRHPLIQFEYAGYHLQKPIPSTTAHRNAGRITDASFRKLLDLADAGKVLAGNIAGSAKDDTAPSTVSRAKRGSKDVHMLNVVARPSKVDGKDSDGLFSTANASAAARAKSWLADRIAKSKKLGSSELISEVVNITPEMAEVILAECNRGNRPFKNKRFRYAEDMTAGLWKLTSQGISFARDGTLNNGQNRLAAIVISGRAQKFLVTWGEHRDVFDVLDTGTGRGGTDTLSSLGYKNASSLAAAVRAAIVIDEMRPFKAPGISNKEVATFAGDHPELTEVVPIASRFYGKFKNSRTSFALALYRIISTSSLQWADGSTPLLEEFYESIIQGGINHPKNPLQVLRDGLLANNTSSSSSEGERVFEVAGSVVNTWNLWTAGKRGSEATIRWRIPVDAKVLDTFPKAR